MRRELWHREIEEENAKLHNSREAGDFNAQKQKEEELVQKRMHELRHAQGIQQLYETKRKKVDRILAKIERLNQQMEMETQKAITYLHDVEEAAVSEVGDSRSLQFLGLHQYIMRSMRSICIRL